MSRANIEVVRACYEAFADHRFPRTQFTAEVEWATSPNLPDAATYRGREAVGRYFSEWVAGWAEVRNDPVQLLDAGDQVVAMVHGSFRLAEDSPPFERDYAHLWTLRDGLVIRVQAMDRDDALEAAGLSE